MIPAARLIAGAFAALGLAGSMASCRAAPEPEYYPPGLAVTPAGRPAKWQPCAWDPPARDRKAQCTFVSVPVDYGEPGGDRFRLLLKRRQASAKPRAQIWLVHGGPGASATAGMKDLSFGIPELRPDIAFYAVDHRGVGGSERLGCPRQEAADSPGGTAIDDSEWLACIASVQAGEGARLAHYSTTDSARDLAQLIAQFRQPGVPVIVYGASYGTYLVRRYLELASAKPDAVILEGLVAADGGMTGYDARMEQAADQVLAACDAAPACASHFKAPLRDETSAMLASLAKGHCSVLNLRPDTTRQLLAAMTFFANSRVMVPPLVHRVRRCDWRDVIFVARLALNFAAAARSSAYSPVLHNHVVLSEMYRPGQPDAVLRRQFADAVLSTGMELSYARLYPEWPRYPPVAVTRNGADFAGPMLMLQGGLDTPSPIEPARRAASTHHASAQHLVVFPQGAHGVSGQTPTRDGSDCARQIYLAFVDHPTATPDTACIGRIRPLDWTWVPPGARALTGTDDLWGD